MIEAERAVLATPPTVDRPFDIVMAIWARWMHLKDSQRSEAEGNPQDTKEFMALGEAVSTMVDDLPRLQWWAVLRSRGICTVWRYPHDSLMDALAEAEAILTPKLMKHIATKRYFN